MAIDMPNVDINSEFDKALNPENPQPNPLANVAPPFAQQPEPQALQGSTAQSVKVFSPEGEIGEIPHNQLQEAIEAGYRPATQEEVDNHLKEQKYGTLGQQIKTGLEGAASAATFGLSTGLERMAGVKPEDIQARREVNPGSHMLGQAAGLLGSAAIPGVGAANLLERAGAEGAAALGIRAGETALSKIGSSATQAAIENMVFQSGDEVSKMLASDPTQSVDTAIADIGLSGLLGGTVGGAVGAANPLWQATLGKKLGGTLDAFSKRLGGIEGQIPDTVNDAISKSGMEIAPEIRAAFSKDPTTQQMFQHLQEASTGSGIKAQEALKNFKTETSNQIASALGKTPEEIDALTDLSENEAGTSLKNALKEHLKAITDPVTEQYAKLKEEFSSVPLEKDVEVPTGKFPDKDPFTGQPSGPEIMEQRGGTASKIAEDLTNVAQREGWTKVTDSDEMNIINKVLKDTPKLDTLEDLRRYQSAIGEETHRKQLWKVGKEVRQVLQSAEDDLVQKSMMSKYAGNPEVIQSHTAAKSAYKDLMNTIDSLNDRLHVGRFNGPGSFIKALNDMSPEDVLRRLSPKGDAGIIGELTTKFPEVAKRLQDYHLNQVLKSASTKATQGELINSKHLFNSIEKMSPEMREFVIPAGGKEKLDAINHLLQSLPAKMNTSGTAKTLDSLFGSIPGTAVGAASMVFGHNPAVAGALGYLTKLVSRDVPDAVRLATLKFLGSNKPIDAAGFKALVDFIHSTQEGQKRILDTTKNVFKAGTKVMPESMMPSESDRKKLDKQVKALQANNSDLYNVGTKTAHYMPEAGTAMAQTAVTAVNYLNSVRPTSVKAAPLDPEMPPSEAAMDEYNRALDVAAQPLVVLNHIKNGTLQVNDIKALNSMYPGLYSKLSQQLTRQMTDAVAKGQDIDFHTRMSLSLFLQQPLDSTMTPMAIMDAQPKQPDSPQQQNSQAQGNPRAKHSMTALNKLPGAYQTASQSRQQAQQNKTS